VASEGQKDRKILNYNEDKIRPMRKKTIQHGRWIRLQGIEGHMRVDHNGKEDGDKKKRGVE